MSDPKEAGVTTTLKGLDPQLHMQAKLEAIARKVHLAEVINEALRHYFAEATEEATV